MLRLALLRHAKSSWDEPGLLDIDRPLNGRGKAAAPVMGRMLASLNFAPDVILCSPATRTRETLALISPELSGRARRRNGCRRSMTSCIWLSPASCWTDLRALPDTAKSVLVIGHNPGLHELAARSCTSGDIGQIASVCMTNSQPPLWHCSASTQTTFKFIDPDAAISTRS